MVFPLFSWKVFNPMPCVALRASAEQSERDKLSALKALQKAFYATL